MNLEVGTTDPLVDDVDHGSAGDGGVAHEGDDAEHGETAVDHLGGLGDAHVLVVGDEAVGLLVLGAGLEEEGVGEGEGAEGGADRNEEEVSVGDEDDGTLVGDGVLVGDGGEGAPLLEVEDGVGIGDESVALGVGGGAHEDPAEHGVTAVPLLGLDGGTPAVLGEGGVLLLPVLDALAEDVLGEHGGVEVEAGGAAHVIVSYRSDSQVMHDIKHISRKPFQAGGRFSGRAVRDEFLEK